ncbi:DegT/DnrJ/EryC1/StrS family aminotransferase [Nocardioides mesophilus]|uniref:DegT/DnrJ/EryC1/StrS family aminotransferase n=2 Tax=Nocardioides mesophilus TaxID=433659 RepID=A0A7G9RHP4_9ACTN|nr:DegT/DnrJ/EryC1/StrS family aminotransferase [Nocardioides mesophilus]
MRPTLPDLPALERRLGQILESGLLTSGPTVAELEERVAERLGVAHVVAVSSCTSGLALTLQALGVHDAVVMPSFTFSASAHAVMWAGAEPRFVDIEAGTLCVDPDEVWAGVDGASAITATHIYGTPCRTEALEEVAREAGVPLVFDAAHGLGSSRAGRPVGGFGTAEVFSLSPTKVMVAGEGGLVATNDAGLAETVRLGRNYGNPGDYDCLFAGLNARMSELHAAIGLHSLRFLDEHVARRNELVDDFWSGLADLRGLSRPVVEEGDVSTYKDLTVVVDPDVLGLDVPGFARALDAEGIDTRRYYSPSIHEQRAYRHLPQRDLPVTEEMSQRVLSLPLWSHMTDQQMTGMRDAVARIARHADQIRATEGDVT